MVILTVVDEYPASFDALITWLVELCKADDPVIEPASSRKNPSGRGGCDVHCMGWAPATIGGGKMTLLA